MKTKTFLLCLMSLFVIFSCSSSDDDNSVIGPEVEKQIKKLTITQLQENGSYITSIFDFVYENGKVARWDIDKNNQKIVYYFKYEGDKLTTITTTEGDEIKAFYDGSRLISSITTEDGVTSKENYRYNSAEQLIQKLVMMLIHAERFIQ